MNKEQRTRRIFRMLKIIYLLIFIAIDWNAKLRITFSKKNNSVEKIIIRKERRMIKKSSLILK